MDKVVYYRGVIYFRDGNMRKTSPTTNRNQAERDAIRQFEVETRMAVSEYFKPIRYQVIEDDRI